MQEGTGHRTPGVRNLPGPAEGIPQSGSFQARPLVLRHVAVALPLRRSLVRPSFPPCTRSWFHLHFYPPAAVDAHDLDGLSRAQERLIRMTPTAPDPYPPAKQEASCRSARPLGTPISVISLVSQGLWLFTPRSCHGRIRHLPNASWPEHEPTMPNKRSPEMTRCSKVCTLNSCAIFPLGRESTCRCRSTRLSAWSRS